MTGIPQDVRSPIQQSRWVQAYNSGSVAIPAHGVCEVDSNTVTLLEHSDALYVKRPTAAGLPECVVNGPVPIPVGKYGWVTLDFPVYALGSASMNNGDMVGTAANSFTLELGKPGFMVLGNGPETGVVRVKELWEPLIRGTLGAELCPDTATATIATSWVSRNSLLITSAENIYALAGANGADVALQWDGVLEEWVVLQVEHRLQKVITDVTKGTCKIDKSYIQKVSLMYCGAETTDVAVQFYEKTFVADIQHVDSASGSGSAAAGSCALQKKTFTLCVFDDATASAWSNVISYEPVVVMGTLRQNGVCLEGFVQVVYVPCSGDGGYVNLVCGTTCGSGS